MKRKILLIIGAVIFLIGAFVYLTYGQVDPRVPVETNQVLYEGDAPVYVTFYSHNEDSWKSVVSTQQGYEGYRDGLIERAEIFAEYDIPWDWQTDQPVLDAMIEYDDYETLPYIQELGALADPHAHTNNYADIAYLMEVLGGKASSVIGGLIHVACGEEHLGFLNFVSWHDQVELQADGYVHGSDYPDALWRPLVLSDPGMGGHWFDDWTSGVWKPGDEDGFYSHSPENDIIYIGEGYPHDTLLIGSEQASGAEIFASDGAYVKELVRHIQNNELPTGTSDGEEFMYTASIHVRDTSIVDEGGDEPVNTAEGLRAIIEELLPLEASGDIVFVNFEQAARIWQNQYDSVPNQAGFEEFSFYQDVRSQAENYCESTGPGR